MAKNLNAKDASCVSVFSFYQLTFGFRLMLFLKVVSLAEAEAALYTFKFKNFSVPLNNLLECDGIVIYSAA